MRRALAQFGLFVIVGAVILAPTTIVATLTGGWG